MIEMQLTCGDDIHDVINRAIATARDKRQSVLFEVNGVTLSVDSKSEPGNIYKRYRAVLAVNALRRIVIRWKEGDYSGRDGGHQYIKDAIAIANFHCGIKEEA